MIQLRTSFVELSQNTIETLQIWERIGDDWQKSVCEYVSEKVRGIFPFNHKPFKHTVCLCSLLFDGSNSIFIQYYRVKCSNVVPDFLLCWCTSQHRVIETTLMFEVRAQFFFTPLKKHVDKNSSSWFLITSGLKFLSIPFTINSCVSETLHIHTVSYIINMSGEVNSFHRELTDEGNHGVVNERVSGLFVVSSCRFRQVQAVSFFWQARRFPGLDNSFENIIFRKQLNPNEWLKAI